MDEKKTIRLVGGPLDGLTKEVDKGQTIYVLKEPLEYEDMEGELPVSHAPNFYEVTYEETSEGSSVFVVKK